MFLLAQTNGLGWDSPPLRGSELQTPRAELNLAIQVTYDDRDLAASADPARELVIGGNSVNLATNNDVHDQETASAGAGKLQKCAGIRRNF